jgi:hypothetical protein
VLLLLLMAGRAEAARIVVTIDGLHSGRGNVVVALYSRAEGFPDGDYSDRHVKVGASTAPLTVIFDDLVPGTTPSAPITTRTPTTSSTPTSSAIRRKATRSPTAFVQSSPARASATPPSRSARATRRWRCA